MTTRFDKALVGFLAGACLALAPVVWDVAQATDPPTTVATAAFAPEHVFDARAEEETARFLDRVFDTIEPPPAGWRGPPALGVLRETRNPRKFRGFPQDHD